MDLRVAKTDACPMGMCMQAPLMALPKPITVIYWVRASAAIKRQLVQPRRGGGSHT